MRSEIHRYDLVYCQQTNQTFNKLLQSGCFNMGNNSLFFFCHLCDFPNKGLIGVNHQSINH